MAHVGRNCDFRLDIKAIRRHSDDGFFFRLVEKLRDISSTVGSPSRPTKTCLLTAMEVVGWNSDGGCFPKIGVPGFPPKSSI